MGKIKLTFYFEKIKMNSFFNDTLMTLQIK